MGHYTDGRRWSYISNAWILVSSWNDQEEIASLRVRVAELESNPQSEASRTIVFTVEEIAFVINELAREHHDGSDFEAECPSCTAYAKLKSSVDWDERHGTVGLAPTEDTQ